MIEIIALLILGLLSLLALCYLYSGPRLTQQITTQEVHKSSLEDLQTHAQTGDLVFFSGTNDFERLIRSVTNAPITHCAMIVRENHELFFWEADVGSGYRDGPRLMHFHDKLSRWKGEPCLIWRRINQPLNTEEVLKIATEMISEREMDTFFISYLLGKRKDQDRRITCSELIALTLEKLGRLKITHAVSLAPKDLLYIDGYGLSSYVVF